MRNALVVGNKVVMGFVIFWIIVVVCNCLFFALIVFLVYKFFTNRNRKQTAHLQQNQGTFPATMG